MPSASDGPDGQEFLAALAQHGGEPCFTDERDYKIYILERDFKQCLANLENLERRLTLLEGKNVNGRQ